MLDDCFLHLSALTQIEYKKNISRPVTEHVKALNNVFSIVITLNYNNDNHINELRIPRNDHVVEFQGDILHKY